MDLEGDGALRDDERLGRLLPDDVLADTPLARRAPTAVLDDDAAKRSHLA